MYYCYRYFEKDYNGSYEKKFRQLSEEELKELTEEGIRQLLEGINNSCSDVHLAICELENIRNGNPTLASSTFIGEEEAKTMETYEYEGNVVTILKDIVVTDEPVFDEIYYEGDYIEYLDGSLATKILDKLEVRNFAGLEYLSDFDLLRVLKYMPRDEVGDFVAYMNSCYGDLSRKIWRYLIREKDLDKEFMTEMIQKGHVYQFGFLDSELQNDTDIQRSFIQAVIENGTYFQFASIYPILDDDLKEMVKQAYIQHINDEQTPNGYKMYGIDGENIPDELKNDADFMLELLKKGTSTGRIFFEDVGSELANNREFVLSVLENTDADVNYDNIGLDIFNDDEVMDKIDFKLREREERARQQSQGIESEVVNPKVKKLGELIALEEKIDDLTKKAEHILDENRKKIK